MLHLQLLPPLGHLPHVLRKKKKKRPWVKARVSLYHFCKDLRGGSKYHVFQIPSVKKETKAREGKGLEAPGLGLRPQCPTKGIFYCPTFSLCQGLVPSHPPPRTQSSHLQHLLQALQLALQALALAKGQVPLLRHPQELAL